MPAGRGETSRRESTLIQFGGGLGQMVLASIQGILLVPLYLTKLSGELYGMWLALTSMVALLGFFELGLANLVCQQSAVCLSRRDHRRLGVLVATVLPYTVGVMALVAVGGMLLAPWVPGWVGARGTVANSLSLALYVAVLDLVLMLADGITGSMLLGLQRPGVHMAALLVGTAGAIVATLVLLYLDWGILALACGSLVRPLVALPANVVALAGVLRHELHGSPVRFERKPFFDFFFTAGYLGPARAAEVLGGQLDNLILIALLRPVDVTVLSLTRKSVDLVVQVAGRLATSSLAGLAHLYGSRQRECYGPTVLRLLRISLGGTALGLTGILLLNGTFVRLWAGAEWFGGQALTSILCLFACLRISRVTFSNILFAAGEVRVTAASSMVETLAQLVAGFVLCRVWGIPGVAAGACLASAAAIAVQYRGLAATLEWRGPEPREALIDAGWILGLLAGGWLVGRFWMPAGWTAFVACGLGLGGLGTGILLARHRVGLASVGSGRPRLTIFAGLRPDPSK